jgi:deoxyguanosine kinase
MIISIEGNIGSGKSTLVKILKEELKNDDRFIFIPEPVDEWLKITDSNSGENILSKFYQNQEKYSFPFQVLTFTSKLKLIKDALQKNSDKIIITERSVYTDKEVFAKMLFNDKKIDEICYQIYFAMFNEFLDDTTDLDKIIFVNTEHNICHKRVNKRNRNGEKIELEYLEKCGSYHQNWLLELNNVLVLDGNTEFENDKNTIDEWIQKIFNFIECEKYVKYLNKSICDVS